MMRFAPVRPRPAPHAAALLLLSALAAGCGGGGPDEAADRAAPEGARVQTAPSPPAGAAWWIEVTGGAGETIAGPGGRVRFVGDREVVQLQGDQGASASFRMTGIESGDTGTREASSFRIQLPDGWTCEDDPAQGEPPAVTLERNTQQGISGRVEGAIQCGGGTERRVRGEFDVG